MPKGVFPNGNKGQFKKGNIPWDKDLKGIHLCPESEFKKGHKFGLRFGFGQKEYRGEYTQERMKNLFEGRKKVKGERNGNWRGGITPINLKIRTSKEYIEWRKSVFKKDNYTCQFCGQKGDKIVADHIKPFALFPEYRLDINNGRTLCEICHRKTETYGHKTTKLLTKITA